MGNRKIVITGISAISAVGTGFDAHVARLTEPVHTTPVKAFEFHELDTEVTCYKATGYDPAEVLGKKGLRLKDWSTKLLLGTVELAFKDYLESCDDAAKPGICVGTAFGSVGSIGDFLSDSLVNGVDKVNPQAFANTVINAPTGNANIRYAVRNLSTTVATGFNAAVDAVIYACDHIRSGYLDQLLVCGLEEVSYYGLLGMQRSGALSTGGLSRPFATASDGMVAGEGCAAFMLETEEKAKARGARIIAEIAGYCNCFDPTFEAGGFNPDGEGARYAMKQACADANTTPEAVSFVAASANGTLRGDRMEAAAIESIVGNRPVAAYKAKTGECYGASAALTIACALADLANGRISGAGPACEAHPGIDLVLENRTGRADETVLVNAFSCDGNCGSILLKKYQ